MEEIKLYLALLEAGLGTVANNDEIFTNLAKIIRKFHNALVVEGFTEEQAMQLMIGLSSSASKGAKKNNK